MKKTLLFGIATIILSAYSCKKENKEENIVPYFLTATKDNANWTSAGTMFGEISSGNYKLTGGADNEKLNIQMTRNSLNEYALVATATAFQTKTGQDATGAAYILDESATNSITITKNDRNITAEGNFELHFKKVSGDGSYPAGTHFTNGKFKSGPGVQ